MDYRNTDPLNFPSLIRETTEAPLKTSESPEIIVTAHTGGQQQHQQQQPAPSQVAGTQQHVPGSGLTSTPMSGPPPPQIAPPPQSPPAGQSTSSGNTLTPKPQPGGGKHPKRPNTKRPWKQRFQPFPVPMPPMFLPHGLPPLLPHGLRPSMGPRPYRYEDRRRAGRKNK